MGRTYPRIYVVVIRRRSLSEWLNEFKPMHLQQPIAPMPTPTPQSPKLTPVPAPQTAQQQAAYTSANTSNTSGSTGVVVVESPTTPYVTLPAPQGKATGIPVAV